MRTTLCRTGVSLDSALPSQHGSTVCVVAVCYTGCGNCSLESAGKCNSDACLTGYTFLIASKTCGGESATRGWANHGFRFASHGFRFANHGFRFATAEMESLSLGA